MERTPTKRMETLEFERECLLIDEHYRLRLFRHGRKVRCEVERIEGQLILTKTVDLPQGGKLE